jgi:4-hydroxy-tetrahydrodipicolinate synthase
MSNEIDDINSPNETVAAPYRGVTSVLVTPFVESGAIDFDGLNRMVDFVVEAGVRGVTALGVMGESAFLDEAERRAVLEQVARRVPNGIALTVGISDDEQSRLLERARTASANGARAMISVPSSGDLASHLANVADAEPGLDLIVQDYPFGGHPRLTPGELASAIHSVPTVVALKEECPPTAERIRALRELVPQKAIIGGLSALWVADELAAGADGTMTGFAFPERLVHLAALAELRRWDDLREAYEALLPAIVFEAQPGLEVALRKTLLLERGILRSAKTRAPGGVSRSSVLQARELVRRFADRTANSGQSMDAEESGTMGY